jgi:hypothetical protein
MRLDVNVDRPTLGGVGPTGTAGTVFLLLFALPFLGFGLFALVWGLGELRGGNAAQAGILLLFGALFVCVGLGIAVLARRGRRLAVQLEARKARHPDAPWLWNEAWSGGRLRYSARASMRRAWLFAVAWNAISLPLAFLAPDAFFDKGNHGALIAMLFPAVGIGLLAWALHATLRWRRFGESLFEMSRVPGVLGGELAGTLQVGGELAASENIVARVSCIRRYVSGTGKNRSTQEDIRWSDEQQLPPTALARGPFGQALDLRFALPYDASPSDPVASDDYILWRLEVTTRMPGVDYTARFEVPVFETPESQRERTAEALSREKYAGAQTALGRLPSGIDLRRNERGDLEIFFPAGRHKTAAALVTLFGAVFAAAGAGLYAASAGVLLAGVFGGFGALLLYGALGLWAGSIRVAANRGEVTLQRRLLGVGRSQWIPAEEIEGVSLETGLRVGSRVYWDIHLRKKLGTGSRRKRRTGVRVGGCVRDKQEAERLTQLLRDALGL